MIDKNWHIGKKFHALSLWKKLGIAASIVGLQAFLAWGSSGHIQEPKKVFGQGYLMLDGKYQEF